MIKKLLQAVFCLAVVVTLVMPLSACNTMEGIGRDAKAAGEGITDAAQKTKGY
jgi:predicted small secreted protein